MMSSSIAAGPPSAPMQPVSASNKAKADERTSTDISKGQAALTATVFHLVTRAPRASSGPRQGPGPSARGGTPSAHERLRPSSLTARAIVVASCREMLARALVVMIAPAVTLALVAGCGDHPQMMPPPPDMARAPLDHPPLWRLTHGTGAVQAAPEIWTVVWQGDEAIGADTADFVDWMLHSDYWTGSLGEYGIGAGVSKGLVVIP